VGLAARDADFSHGAIDSATFDGADLEGATAVLRSWATWASRLKRQVASRTPWEAMPLGAIKNFVEIDDRVATGGQPSESQLKDVASAGYQVVINLGLLDPKYCLPDEAALVGDLGMEYHHIPVVFTDPKTDDFRRFMTVMDSHREQKVFVHCALNWRVSAFVALYGELRLGWPPSKAEAHMRTFWEPNEVWIELVRACRAMDPAAG